MTAEGPGTGGDSKALVQCRTDEVVSRIAHRRGACVGDQRHVLPLCQRGQEHGSLRGAVVLVVAGGPGVDIVVGQQLARDARVFGGYQVDLAQDPQGAEGDVLDVAYGRSDQVQRCHSTAAPLEGRIRTEGRRC